MEKHTDRCTPYLSKVSVLLVDGSSRYAEPLTENVAALHAADGSREAVISFARNRPDIAIFDLTEENETAQTISTLRTMNPEVEVVGMINDAPETLRRVALIDLDGLVHEAADRENLCRTMERIAGHIHSRKDLARQKRLTELLVHGLPHPALLFDMDSAAILLSNARAEDLGYAAGKICGPPLLPENSQNREDVRSGFAVYSPVGIGEVEIEGRWYDVTLAPASPNTVLLFAADETRRKRLERQRRDVERVVRHDLKTPLNGIIGFSALLAEQSHPPDKAKMFAEQIHDSSTRMLRMINGSLDISRMEGGTYECRPESFDLSDILCRVNKDQERPFRPKLLTVTHMIDGRPLKGTDAEFGWEPILAWGEPRHIESMLGNLMLNAREAAPDRSEITVSVTTGQDLSIGIHNMGTVPKEIRDRFFERYATSGKRGGTGLGTFSAKLICDAHGGDISFTSSEDEGTRVTVKLPGPPTEQSS